MRRVRKETASNGEQSTSYFISDWEEVRDGKLLRYVVHADKRIVRLADGNGAVALEHRRYQPVGPRGASERARAMWTAADPGLLNSPERGSGSDFGAVNAYAW